MVFLTSFMLLMPLRNTKDAKDMLLYLDMLLTVDFEINLDPLWRHTGELSQTSRGGISKRSTPERPKPSKLVGKQDGDLRMLRQQIFFWVQCVWWLTVSQD